MLYAICTTLNLTETAFEAFYHYFSQTTRQQTIYTLPLEKKKTVCKVVKTHWNQLMVHSRKNIGIHLANPRLQDRVFRETPWSTKKYTRSHNKKPLTKTKTVNLQQIPHQDFNIFLLDPGLRCCNGVLTSINCNHLLDYQRNEHERKNSQIKSNGRKREQLKRLSWHQQSHLNKQNGNQWKRRQKIKTWKKIKLIFRRNDVYLTTKIDNFLTNWEI